LLLGRGRAEDLDSAGRIAHAGNRKTCAFKAIFAIWGDDGGVVELTLVPLERYADYFRDAGQHWLAAQYRACLKRLARPAAGGQVNIFVKQPEAKRESNTDGAGLTVRPLCQLRTAKEAWELSLEALERVAATAGPPDVPSVATTRERILWRVAPSNLDIEPYLQVSKSGAFTRGRKLAIKHLLVGAKQLESLPPEDRARARAARELRLRLAAGIPFPGAAGLARLGRASARRASGDRRGTAPGVASAKSPSSIN
jgi:hypothetical protein